MGKTNESLQAVFNLALKDLGNGQYALAICNPDGTDLFTAPLIMTNLTTAERDALTPSNGMIIYNTTLNKLQGYENGAWANLI